MLIKDPVNGEDHLKLVKLRRIIVLSWSVYLNSGMVYHRGTYVCTCSNVSICLSTCKGNGCWLPSAEKCCFEDALGLIGLVEGWKSWLEKHTKRRILKDTSPSLLETLRSGFCHCQRCSSRRSSFIFWGKMLATCSWFAPEFKLELGFLIGSVLAPPSWG